MTLGKPPLHAQCLVLSAAFELDKAMHSCRRAHRCGSGNYRSYRRLSAFIAAKNRSFFIP
jgi:hypothetical protein